MIRSALSYALRYACLPMRDSVFARALRGTPDAMRFASHARHALMVTIADALLPCRADMLPCYCCHDAITVWPVIMLLLDVIIYFSLLRCHQNADVYADDYYFAADYYYYII